MRTFKFAEVLAGLEDLDSWLVELGVAPRPNDRIHRAISVLQQAEAGWKAFRQTRKPTKIGNIKDFHFGIIEALEFCDIYSAFRKETSDSLRPKLQRALEGPFRPRDENQRNAEGRNTMFELALAADLKLQGADVTLGEPDITVFLDRTQFLIECKRPVPEHSIRANVRGAVHQLNAKLDENGRKEAHGIVAISVSRILNPGTSIFVAPANAGRGKLGDQLGMLMRHHESDWKKSGAHKRITAVLFQAVTPAAIGDEQGHGISLVRLSYMTVMPTDTDETGFAPVERNFPTLLNY